MRHPPKAVLAGIAVASLLAPSAAFADRTEWAGFTCGFASTNDPSGAVQQNPDVQMGEINCGPWTAYDVLADDGSGASSNPGGAHIKMCGWIQINNNVYATPPIASASVCAEASGGIVLTAGQITYTATATDNIYLCTEVVMTHTASETYQFDEDDDETNGNQCALAISAGA